MARLYCASCRHKAGHGVQDGDTGGSAQRKGGKEGGECPPPQRTRPEMPALSFSSDPDDHCETSFEAYEQVKPLLLELCKHLRKDAGNLRIYDPYFCTGQTKQLLASLGFTAVYNEYALQHLEQCLHPGGSKCRHCCFTHHSTAASHITPSQVHYRNEDFYKVAADDSLPAHDCLLTNPPFSGSHIEQLMRHCQHSSKPWILLMPTYVANKDYYRAIVKELQCKPFYVVPRKRCADHFIPLSFAFAVKAVLHAGVSASAVRATRFKHAGTTTGHLRVSKGKK